MSKGFMARGTVTEHGGRKEETKFDSLLIASRFGYSMDHMTLEAEDAQEPRIPLYQTSDSLFGSAISPREILRANQMPNKSHAESRRPPLVCFSSFARSYLPITLSDQGLGACWCIS